jgi:hypothetical protein
MKRFAFLTIVVISSLASWLSQAVNEPEISVAFSFETVNTGISTNLTMTTSLESCFKVNGFDWSVADDFAKNFGVVADVSEDFDNRPTCFGTTSGGITFSLFQNFGGSPQVRFPNMRRFVAFARVMAGIVRRNLTDNSPTQAHRT